MITTFLLNSVWVNYFYEKDEVRNEEAYSSWTDTSLSVGNDNKETNVKPSQQMLTSSEVCSNRKTDRKKSLYGFIKCPTPSEKWYPLMSNDSL